MTDEDLNSFSVGVGNILSSSLPSVATPGVTSPLYVATPFDHDYAKRKTLRRQQWQQQRHEEQQADGTVPVLSTVSVLGPPRPFCIGAGSPQRSSQIDNHHAVWPWFEFNGPFALDDWDVVKWAIWLQST